MGRKYCPLKSSWLLSETFNIARSNAEKLQNFLFEKVTEIRVRKVQWETRERYRKRNAKELLNLVFRFELQNIH